MLLLEGNGTEDARLVGGGQRISPVAGVNVAPQILCGQADGEKLADLPFGRDVGGEAVGCIAVRQRGTDYLAGNAEGYVGQWLICQIEGGAQFTRPECPQRLSVVTVELDLSHRIGGAFEPYGQ